MERLPFTKMNGAGNDFVLMDNRSGALQLGREEIARLCDRHRGVGADGLLLVEPAKNEGADFRMRYYNADGGEADMCGNGARCFARYVQRLGWTKPHLRFETGAGLIQAEFDRELVEIRLGPPSDLKLHQKLKLKGADETAHSINTGVPHAVLFVDDADKAMVSSLGAEIRWHAAFQPKGTNVNFVQLRGDHRIRVRTFERGVEGETLACGTGVVASAILSHLVFAVKPPVEVQVQGGDTLRVDFARRGDEFLDVRLKGPADFVFDGEYSLPKAG